MRVAKNRHDCRRIFGLLRGAGPLQHLRQGNAMQVARRNYADDLAVEARTDMVALAPQGQPCPVSADLESIRS